MSYPDRSTDVLVTSAVFLGAATLFVGLRCISKFGIRKRADSDDWVTILAWVRTKERGGGVAWHGCLYLSMSGGDNGSHDHVGTVVTAVHCIYRRAPRRHGRRPLNHGRRHPPTSLRADNLLQLFTVALSISIIFAATVGLGKPDDCESQPCSAEWFRVSHKNRR